MARKKPKGNGVVEKKLIGVADVVITAAQRSQDPALAIPVRSLANVNFNEKRGIIESHQGRRDSHLPRQENRGPRPRKARCPRRQPMDRCI